MLHEGDQIHHYIVESAIGGGGMATVYRVRHAILQSALALKVLDPKWVDRPDIRRRFLAEGRIQALVRHPGIVMVTDAVVDAPRQVAGLVMEYVEGPNLAELIARMKQPPTPQLVTTIARPVLEAIHHAHQEGVIHRDLKPSNVLLSRDAAGSWHPRVADFGIAHVHEAATRLTRLGTPDGGERLGTPAFMSPEQIEGDPPNPKWDVFALGCVLFELATGGTHPFEGPTPAETMTAIRAGTPRELDDSVDPRIAACIRAAIAHDPADRAPDCAALLDLLDARPAVRRPEPPPPPSNAPFPPTFVETTGPTHDRKAWRIHRPMVEIGREDVDISVGSVANVASVHCSLHWDGSAWICTNRSDLGTRVNGARIGHIALEDGDLIRVGHQVLKFHTQPAEVAKPPVRLGPRLEVPGRHLEPPVNAEQVVSIHTRGVLIGRAEGCDLRLGEPGVAQRHCKITLQGLDVVVEDLGSPEGTRVDGQTVRFRRLQDGAEIGIGGARLRFRAR